MWNNVMKLLHIALEEEFTIRPYHVFIDNAFNDYKFKFIIHPNRLCYKKEGENKWTTEGHLGEEVVYLLVSGYYEIVR